jgi:hypothetical protein
MKPSKKSISDLEDLIKTVKDVNVRFKSQVWWRGQRSDSWGLIPSVLRNSQRARSEQSLISRFQHKAPSRHTSVPSFEDKAGWLFLMQHYRLPTRLLDWTESPLIACYFAAEQDPAIKSHPNQVKDKDGEIFALSPYRLNFAQVDQRALLLPDDPIAEKSIDRAFSRVVEDPNYVVAVRPSEVDTRLMVQLSVFTIHGSGLTIESLAGVEDFLVKFTIPKSAKTKLRKQLKNLGIRESSIFPDLEHLAIDVAATKFKPGSKPIDPSTQHLYSSFPRDPESSSG